MLVFFAWVCVGVRQLLAVDPEVEILAAVADQRPLRQTCDEEHPDVVLTDIRMPPTHRLGRRRSAEIDQAMQLLDSGAITQAEFDASMPRRSRSAQRS